MAANLQYHRSASVSKTSKIENSGKLMKTSSVGGDNNLRSASIGAGYLKDNSHFFGSNDTDPTTVHSGSLVDEGRDDGGEYDSLNSEANDLDLVGALGNLNLDEVFDARHGRDTNSPPEEPMGHGFGGETRAEGGGGGGNGGANAAAAFLQHLLYGSGVQGMYDVSNNLQHQLYGHPYSQNPGSLTPNSAVAGGFVPVAFGQMNTPTSPWSNSFIPSSAPPMTYRNGNVNADTRLNIKPFELPDEKQMDYVTNVDGNSSRLHLPFSTPPPALDSFGGTLNSQMPSVGASISLGMTYGYPGGFKKPDGSSSESEVESSVKTDSTKGTPGPTINVSGNTVDVVPNSGKQFQTVIGVDASVNQTDMKDGAFFNTNMGYQKMGMPQMLSGPSQAQAPLWNHHLVNYNSNSRNHPNVLMNKRVPGNNGSGSYNNSPGNAPRTNNRRFHNNNDSVNIHRKMHNNKRKGDDALKYANAKLEDFNGEIYSLCKDQHGCRFLQHQLDLGREAAANPNADTGKSHVLTNDVAASMIFNEIYLKIIELMTDPFGNYLIQKLFENVSTDQRIILVKNSSPEFIRIALDTHGTRALQKLVECITTEEESNLIIKSLSPHIVSLSRDLNGNHVVQKCLQKLKPSENQFIFDTASKHCNEIATHRHGCCVLQRCLDHGTSEQRKQLSLKVAENATNLSLDPFGNYVVQYVLSRGDDESIAIIMDHIKRNIITLSFHKFGSNVIEKSLRINKLTDSLIEVLLNNSDRFAEMLNDAYGNYVLQTSLDVAKASDLTKLSQALEPLLPNIKSTPHGRRIMIKIQNT